MDIVTISDCHQFLKVYAQFLYFILANGQLIVCKIAFSYRLQFVQHLVRKAERKYCWNTDECAVHPRQGMGTVSQNHGDPLFSSLLPPSLLFKGQRVHPSCKSSFPLLFSRSGNLYLSNHSSALSFITFFPCPLSRNILFLSSMPSLHPTLTPSHESSVPVCRFGQSGFTTQKQTEI